MFTWFMDAHRIIWKGFRKPLTQSDLFNLPLKVDVNENVKKFQKEWDAYLKRNNITFYHKTSNPSKKKTAKIWIPLFRTLGWMYLLGTSLAIIHYTIIFIGPQVSIIQCIIYSWGIKGFNKPLFFGVKLP